MSRDSKYKEFTLEPSQELGELLQLDDCHSGTHNTKLRRIKIVAFHDDDPQSRGVPPPNVSFVFQMHCLLEKEYGDSPLDIDLSELTGRSKCFARCPICRIWVIIGKRTLFNSELIDLLTKSIYQEFIM